MLHTLFDDGAQLRFPAESFVSQAEFEAHRQQEAATHARQARIEAALAGPDAAPRREAVCAACLRPAMLTLRGGAGTASPEASPEPLPDWAAAQECDCEDHLPCAARALLHAALALGGLCGWTRLLLFGPPAPLHRRLAALAGEARSVPDLRPGPALDAPDGGFDLIVAADALHRAPALRALLTELRRAAAPGATLLATFPFRERAAGSGGRRPRIGGARLAPGELHAIGWDVLPALRDCGWAEAEMLRCWSRALGYLGPRNFLLRAVA